MKVTRKFIEGFVEGCYENGLTEKQASWLLDRYIAEGNGEILEKSAAGKSIINLLLLLLALGGGAYGLDRLGGTNTALGKWLKDNLGAGNWGIKDALEGLFSPAANPAPTTVPGADNKHVAGQSNAPQATNGWDKEWSDRQLKLVTGKDSLNVGGELRRMISGGANKSGTPTVNPAPEDNSAGTEASTTPNQSANTPFEQMGFESTSRNNPVINSEDFPTTGARELVPGGSISNSETNPVVAANPAPTTVPGADNKHVAGQSNAPQATNGWDKEWSDRQLKLVTGKDSLNVGW